MQTRGFNRIVVLGLRSGLDPTQAAAHFGDLLNAHHYTDGFELLPHGAPTNNTQDTASALTSHDPNFAKLFALEQGPALCPARPTADGDRFARALGLDPAVLAHISGAAAGQDEDAAALNAVLWPATWGYYLEDRRLRLSLNGFQDDATGDLLAALLPAGLRLPMISHKQSRDCMALLSPAIGRDALCAVQR